MTAVAPDIISLSQEGGPRYFLPGKSKVPRRLVLVPLGLNPHTATFNCIENYRNNYLAFGWTHGCLNQSYISINMDKG